MYIGEAHTSLDEKGRLTVPTQFRPYMDAHDHDVWFLTRGFDGAVFMFPKERWDKLVSEAGGNSTLDPRLLDFRRLFLGGAAKSKRDRQNRLPIAAHLRDYADIQKEAVLIGVDDHLELWSSMGWAQFQKRQAEHYKSMAGILFGAERHNGAQTEGDERDAESGSL